MYTVDLTFTLRVLVTTLLWKWVAKVLAKVPLSTGTPPKVKLVGKPTEERSLAALTALQMLVLGPSDAFFTLLIFLLRKNSLISLESDFN